MLGVDRILVVIQRKGDAVFVLEKAKQLAQQAQAGLEIIRVIYEGFADLSVHGVEERQELKTFVMQAEETWLEDLVDPVRGSVKSLETATIWNKDTWQGIVDAAAEGSADLILKAANVDQGLGTIVHTPEDWNLLRHSEVPVMLVKPRAWIKDPVIVAAVDGLSEDQADLNKSVLREADHLAKILGGELHVVAAYPFSEPWMGPVTLAVDFSKVKREIEGYIRDNIKKWTEECDIDYKYLYVEEGKPNMVIANLIKSCDAEMLVMGTIARSGIKGIVLGNTSESIIHHTDCDIVVLK